MDSQLSKLVISLLIRFLKTITCKEVINKSVPNLTFRGQYAWVGDVVLGIPVTDLDELRFRANYKF